MAQIDRLAAFPNVLHVHGADVAVSSPSGTNVRRDGVKSALFSDANGIGNFRGQADFIHCYVVGATASNHAGVDHAPAKESPPLRPLRGIIQEARDLRPPSSDGQLANHMGGIAHEMSHYWLVPGRARVKIGSTEVETPTADEIAVSLNNGLGLPQVPIIGRQDSHWSPYIHAEGSFMDGINHEFDPVNPVLEQIYGFSKSNGVPTTGVPFEFEGRELTPATKFNDFELFLMGLPPLIGTPQQRVLQVLEPDWVYPVRFHAGLYVELQSGETWYHGFHMGPHQIRALPVNDLDAEPITWLASPFDPHNRVVFRVIQIGGECELQARVFEPQRIGAEGCLYAILTALGAKFLLRPKLPKDLDCDDVLENPGFAPAANRNVYEGWRRLAHLPAKVSRFGLAARHIDGTCFARIRPKTLCLSHAGASVPVEPNLNVENAINFADASWGRTILSDGSLVLPYRIGPNTGALLKHDAQVDDAPRRVMDAPAGDFVFGGELELSQCTLVSWAGGGGRDKTYVGRRREVRFADVDYLAHWGDEYETIRQAEPAGGYYRFLFCLVSEGALSAADRDAQLAELDRIRRAWEAAFSAMTSGRRLAETSIPFP